MRIPGIPFVQGRNDYKDKDGRHYGIAIHNTSNNASDTAEANYAKRRTDGVSSHLYTDKDSITQSLDLQDNAGHAGSAEGNNHSISIEITGTNGWSRQQWLANVPWEKLGAAIAWILKNDPDYAGFQVRRASVSEMKANPKVKALYGHDDMRRAWGGTDHTDPGPNFPWDRLIQAIKEEMAPPPPPVPENASSAKKGQTTMLMATVKNGDKSVWLSWDGKGRIGMQNMDQVAKIRDSGVPVIEVSDIKFLDLLLGPVRTA